MQRTLIALLALPALLAGGCVTQDALPTDVTIARSALERDPAPAVPAADLASVVAGDNAFAFDLYHQLAGARGNLIFSPHSVSIALAMAYAGAANDTASELATALHFDLAPAALHPAFNALDLALASRGQGAQGADGQPFRLRVVNAAWAERTYTFLPAFLDTLAVNYGAGVRLLDFVGLPEPSRLTINAWVSDQTEARIPDLLPEGSITTDTRLVLTNAVYFNAAWGVQFEPQATADAAFTRADGATIQVPTMVQTDNHRYASQDGWTALELPYDGGEVAMLLVTAADFASFESAFDTAVLADIDAALTTTRVEVSLPKFEYRKSTALATPLQALGIHEAFSPRADFSAMSAGNDLSISDVLHEAFIKLDERGTEAAAATAVIIGTTSVPPTPVPVRFDHPFVYLIRDVQTGAILFVGRVMDPSAG